MSQITTIQTKESKKKVLLTFAVGGWALSYFENPAHINNWITAMQEKHGRISSTQILDCPLFVEDED